MPAGAIARRDDRHGGRFDFAPHPSDGMLASRRSAVAISGPGPCSPLTGLHPFGLAQQVCRTVITDPEERGLAGLPRCAIASRTPRDCHAWLCLTGPPLEQAPLMSQAITVYLICVMWSNDICNTKQMALRRLHAPAGAAANAGAMSRAKRRRLSREPPQFMITYSTPARRKRSSFPAIASGVPVRPAASASAAA
jgi:hypothetical protein